MQPQQPQFCKIPFSTWNFSAFHLWFFLFQVIKLNDVGHLVDKFEYISDPDDLTGLNDLISHENLSDLDDLDCLFDFKKF